ncbi:MAG: electron transport complex subunit RsxA [Fusobacteria bacterium]|nr:electron transport complex subunit RsxA [Fusobacteriota bacterium]
MNITLLFGIVITSIFINNIIFAQFLGLCPFFGVTKKMSSALGMGMAVTFVLTLSSAITWVVNFYLLIPFKLEYLQTVVFILVIASLVQFVELLIQKSVPALYQSLGVFLPLITTNCAVLGIALINISKSYNFIESTVNGFATAIGFTIALLLMSGIREKLEHADIPRSFKGLPITFITAGLLAIAFMGFSGMKL